MAYESAVYLAGDGERKVNIGVLLYYYPYEDKQLKIGILVSMINNFGEKGFYNSQEVGLGKMLAINGNIVIVYKLLREGSVLPDEFVEENLTVQYSTVKSLGINGIVKTKLIETDLDALLFFSDTQLSVPRVFKWCEKNKIIFIPYIGVIESHSSSKIIAWVMNQLFRRNVQVFKKSCCLAKNSDVKRKLLLRGVKEIYVAPVGIDLDLLKDDFDIVEKDKLKMKYGFSPLDKVILFVGRLEEEKHPVELIEYFKSINDIDSTYRLIIIGKGSLFQEMMGKIHQYQLKSKILYIEKLQNNKMWEIYCCSDCFVNLNRHEIFGMAILEAMYYKNKVVAWHAPGPDYIIEDHKSGYLVSNGKEFCDSVMYNSYDVVNRAHERVINDMTWKKTADMITEIANSKMVNRK